MADPPARLPVPAPSLPDAGATRALVGRLVRGGMGRRTAALIDGPLATAVSKAADYAGKSIAPGKIATYKGDWADFSRWARQHGVDPTVLPVHPVEVAAWLAMLAPAMGPSALRRRVAAIAWHHRSRGQVFSSGHAAIRDTLSGIRRDHPRPVRPAWGLTSVEVRRLIAAGPSASGPVSPGGPQSWWPQSWWPQSW